MPVIQINDQSVAFEAGQTLLEVCRAQSIAVPTLCLLNSCSPTGACGVCLVEDAKTHDLVRSCSTPAREGMVIRTDSHAVHQGRRRAIEALIASGNHNCGVAGTSGSLDFTDLQMTSGDLESEFDLCPAWGDCRLQDLAYEYQARVDELGTTWRERMPDLSNPMIVRDYSRCIVCGRCVKACDEVQGNRAIEMDGTGTLPTVPGGGSLVGSDCVFCGECVQACPVGALVDKKSRGKWRPREVEKIRTTCPYCGVGCQQLLHVREGKIVKVTGVEGAQPNQGRLCVKGRFGYDFIYSQERLTSPLVRKDGELTPVSWDEALDYTAKRLKQIIEESGPDAVAGVSCARSINEDSYQMQKLFRAVFKTNNIDHCART